MYRRTNYLSTSGLVCEESGKSELNDIVSHSKVLRFNNITVLVELNFGIDIRRTSCPLEPGNIKSFNNIENIIKYKLKTSHEQTHLVFQIHFWLERKAFI